MSEYQYYEFLTVDRLLAPEQVAELRVLSAEAAISPTGLIAEYRSGGLAADPASLLEHYFDAFLHTSNSGIRRLMFRVPLTQLSLELAHQYCGTKVASARADGQNLIIELSRENQDDAGWDETDLGEGWLSTIVPVRAGLIAGDRRLLYLGWLLSADSGELDDDVLEPPVPADLANLGEALRGVADFLDLDEDLLDIAADASSESADNAGELALWIAQLPSAEKDALLLRAAQGENAQLQAELQLGFRRFTGLTARPEPVTGRRSVGELLGSMQQLQLGER